MDNELVFDERELKEIQHAVYYADVLAHGTVGHNLLMLLAKVAERQGFWMDPTGVLMYKGQDAFEYFRQKQEIP